MDKSNDAIPSMAPTPQPTFSRKTAQAAVSGWGGAVMITALAYLTAGAHVPVLIAPFGASSVLAFALPQSPLAQPRNLIGGHLISATAGLAAYAVFGTTPWSFGIGVGVAIIAMELTGTTHPPAGADPIVVILAKAGWSFLLTPVLAGATLIVVFAIVYHWMVSRRHYPATWR